MRFVFRLISLAALVAAIVAGTLDAVHSVVDGTVFLTPLGAAWASVGGETVGTVTAFVHDTVQSAAADATLRWVLAQPAAAVFLVVSLAFYWAGRKRMRRTSRFAGRALKVTRSER